MLKSQDEKFDTIEKMDIIVGIDVSKNKHWASIMLPSGKEVKKSVLPKVSG